MKIEDAIQQKTPFKSIWQKTVVNLIYTHNFINNRHKDLFKPYGITPQQYNVLRILRGQFPKPMSTSCIRERMLDHMSDVSRIVDRLVKKDLVKRNVCKSDKRLVDVVIGKKGLEVLEEIDNKINILDELIGNLTEQEAETLNELLDKLRE
ncbi:MAG: MarR family transcriptional regulator [Bacteroidetes bacterium]|nr:MarR family transcriptional regulator [Bacteroidota bacterium]MCB0843820.1 MarR family transcriptional regulator [Bacteroidota bacterium]MCB0851557.1 MarR family transcriptional regulator [Bacteroidota bacterium]